MSQETSTKELTEIIVRAIQEEPYFTKEVLIPKIRGLITGFRLKLSTVNYNSINNPTEISRLIRANEFHNLQKEFWKATLKELVGKENMKQYYDALEIEQERWGEKVITK